MKFTDTEKGWLLDTKGIERQHIYNWEQGGGISIKYLQAVAKVKRISVDELVRILNEEEKNGKTPAVGVSVDTLLGRRSAS